MATNTPQQHASAAGGESAPDATLDDQTASPTLGGLLRRGREQRGLSLQQVAEQTKIARRHLESLEQDDLAALPAGPYRRGQVIAFAQVVGLDRDVALAHLERALDIGRDDDDSAADAVVKRDPAPDRTISGRTLAVAGAMALVATFAVWMWRSGTAQPPGDAASPRETPPSRETSTSPVSAVAAPESASVETPLAAPLEELPAGEPQLARATIAAPPVADANPSRRTPLDRPVLTEAAKNAAPTSAVAAATKMTRPAAAAHRLLVTTEPAGARVTIDGIGWGVTPLSLANVAPGTKRIRVTRDGYTSEQRTVTVPADGAATVRVRLREIRSTRK